MGVISMVCVVGVSWLTLRIKYMIFLKVAVEVMWLMKMPNRYAEHMHNFSVRLMVPSHSYGNLTRPVIGSERQEILLLLL